MRAPCDRIPARYLPGDGRKPVECFMRLGQGDPGLQAMHVLAGFPFRCRGPLRMDDAVPGGHPVHGARANDKVGAEGVPVFNRAFEQVGDGRQADMRMRAYVEAFAGGIFHRAEMIEENEGADHALRMETAGPGEHGNRRPDRALSVQFSAR
jgi:hypothetical protein